MPAKQSNRWSIIRKMFMQNYVIACLIELSNVGAGLIDGIIASRMLGGSAMAAFGIAQPFFSLAAIFFGMFATGMQTITGEELGKGNIDNCNRIACATIYISEIFSLCLALICLLGADGLAAFFGRAGTDPELLRGAAAYIRGLAWGVPAIFLTAVMAPAIQMDSGRKRVMVSVGVDFAVNIACDVIAVRIGAGLFGIGLATSIGRYMRVLVLLPHFMSKANLLHFVPLKTDPREFFRMLSMGTEKAWRRVGNLIRPVVVNNLVLLYGGTVAMTAMSIRGSISDITDVLAVGLADTVGLLAGIYFGEKNLEGEQALGRSAHRACAVFCGVAVVVLLAFARPIAAFYAGGDDAAAELTRIALISVALQCPLEALVRSRITYLQRIQKNWNMRFLILISITASPIVSALILGRLFGVYGVLVCYTVSNLLSLIVVWIIYSVKHKKIRPTSTQYLNLPDEFHVGPGDVISLDIRHMEDVSVVSEQIDMFCRGHRVSPEIGRRASICFEEMASTTIQNGFPLNRAKAPIIDLRVVISDDKLVMRLQDNCPKYDVAARIKALSAGSGEDRHADLGTWMTFKLADRINYAYCYETNLLFMEFDLPAPPAPQARANAPAPV